MDYQDFLNVATDLEHAGLLWQPEIGDEVSEKVKPAKISILVDPKGLTPPELRDTYLWLPTVEQLVLQFESRQAILFHAGLDLSKGSCSYETVIHYSESSIQSSAQNLRTSLAISLRSLLLEGNECVN